MFFFFSSRRRHTRFDCDWSSDVCSSDLTLLRPQRRKSHCATPRPHQPMRSEEHTSELQSQSNLVCRLLLEKKKNSIGIMENLEQKTDRINRNKLFIEYVYNQLSSSMCFN